MRVKQGAWLFTDLGISYTSKLEQKLDPEIPASNGLLPYHPELLQICTFINEVLYNCEVAVSGGEHERRVATVVRVVEGRAFSNVLLDPVDMPIHAVAPDVGFFWNESP